ncbi:hypothetical protein [Burkholderia sp. Bp9090]|uniref:hypothetical protein n=1 Tax=Burkholderia sp. Bp9090 TaxID=2184567 RepID=UPI000F5F7AAE|nr:hypothetical protein [Burkholderia sp. Bp9090]
MEATNIKYGTTQATQVVHFSGGIRGFRVPQGWIVQPVHRDEKFHQIGPVPADRITQLANDLSITLLGINEIIRDDPNLLSQIWHPMVVRGSGALWGADRWGAISNQARNANDDDYANLARNVAISLRAADIRLRDASDQYHRQLVAALARGEAVNLRFSNISLSDLHLAFHSLLTEMAAARDYLSAIVARHVDAPRKIDSHARLIDWAHKPVNAHALSHQLITPLIDGWREDTPDRWLFDLGEYRNWFLHREPMGAGGIERGVAIFVTETRFGPVHKVRLDMPIRQGSDEKVEALDRFVYLYGRIQALSEQIAAGAKYASEPPSFVAVP